MRACRRAVARIAGIALGVCVLADIAGALYKYFEPYIYISGYSNIGTPLERYLYGYLPASYAILAILAGKIPCRHGIVSQS